MHAADVVRQEFAAKTEEERMNLINAATQVVLLKIEIGGKFVIHCCSVCGYPCGYYLSNERLRYDNGCDCISERRITVARIEDLEGTFELNPHLIPVTLVGKPWKENSLEGTVISR